METKPDQTPVGVLWTIPAAAEEAGVKRSSLYWAALTRDLVPVHKTADGTPLVLLEDVIAWDKNRPGVGGRPVGT